MLFAAPTQAQQADQYSWDYIADARPPRVYYGVRTNEAVGVHLRCDKARQEVVVTHRFATTLATSDEGAYADAHGRLEPWTVEITLRSGGEILKLAGEGFHNIPEQGTLVTVRAPLGSRVWESVMNGQPLVLEGLGRKDSFPTGQVRDNAIRRFFLDCRKV